MGDGYMIRRPTFQPLIILFGAHHNDYRTENTTFIRYLLLKIPRPEKSPSGSGNTTRLKTKILKNNV